MSIKDKSIKSIAPSAADPEATLLGRLLRVRKLIHLQALHALKPLGLGPKQAAVLRRLRLAGSATCLVALAKSTASDPAALGRIIDGLIRKGLVRPAQGTGKADRRRRHVELTPRGLDLAGRVTDVFNSLDRAMAAGLGAEEGRRFGASLEKLSGHLSQMPAPE
jgi:DNA-binding MarR family transcriptional regulator